MKKDVESKIEKEDPQLSLETIKKVEIQVAERIAAANEQAEKCAEAALKNLAKLKDEIISNARKERDQLYEKGMKEARESVEKRIKSAEKEAESLKKTGAAYIDEAEDYVLAFILGEEKIVKS